MNGQFRISRLTIQETKPEKDVETVAVAVVVKSYIFSLSLRPSDGSQLLPYKAPVRDKCVCAKIRSDHHLLSPLPPPLDFFSFFLPSSPISSGYTDLDFV